MKLRVILFCGVLSACNLLPASVSADLQTFLTGLANKARDDLTVALAVANAATPIDKPGVTCASALLDVQNDIANVLKAANVPTAGVFTAAEVASLFQPGSPQANGERDKLVAGCSVKVAQVSGAIAGTVGWFAQLGTMFAIPIPGA